MRAPMVGTVGLMVSMSVILAGFVLTGSVGDPVGQGCRSVMSMGLTGVSIRPSMELVSELSRSSMDELRLLVGDKPGEDNLASV